jgi:hypothetical protein
MFGVLALMGVVATAAPAGADTITFGGGGSTGFNTNGQFTQVGPVNLGGGLTLTVLPWSNGGSTSNWRIDSENSGYGIYNGVCVSIICDGEDTDGFANIDGLQFNFSAPVNLSQLVFGNWDNGDDVDAGDGSLFSSPVIDGTFGDNTGVWSFGPVVLSSFFLRASGSDDDWRIRSLTYTASQEAPTPAPEPMSLVLFGSGLLGLGSRRFLRRRKV